MVLLNESKKARYTASIITQNQGGGDKKAGLPYIVGRDSWTSIYFNERASCPLTNMQITHRVANQSRPIGTSMRLQFR